MRSGSRGLAPSPGDRDILDHIRRYRITTFEVVWENFFSGQPEQAARSALRRLAGTWLATHPLHGKTKYFQLTPAAAHALGEPRSAALPIGAQTLPRLFGVLSYCCRGRVARVRLTPQEFAKKLPDVLAEGLAVTNIHDYCLQPGPKGTVLTNIVVDLAGGLDRFLQKLRDELHTASRCPSIKALVEEGRYSFSIILSEATRRDALCRALERRPIGVRVNTAVVEDLGRLLVGSTC